MKYFFVESFIFLLISLVVEYFINKNYPTGTVPKTTLAQSLKNWIDDKVNLYIFEKYSSEIPFKYIDIINIFYSLCDDRLNLFISVNNILVFWMRMYL